MKVNLFGARALSATVAERPVSPVGADKGSALSQRSYPEGPYAESFKLMAMNLSVLLSAAPRRGVVVMSPRRRDGRTSVATRLASATAQRGPTLLVASPGRADAEYSSLIRWSRNGDMDEVPEHLRHATATTEHKGLWLVAPQPLSLMRSPSALASFVADATDAGFTTIFDSPPATLASCAFELAHEVGQALYVVRDVGDLEVHRRIYEQLHRLDVKVIGLVVNER